MGEFFNFIKILVFSKTVLLTPNSVTFVGDYEIQPREPVTAITTGASLQIDISSLSSGISVSERGIIEARESLRDLIPEGSVKAVLYGEEESVLLNDAHFLLSNNGAMIVLSASTGVPVNVEFREIKVSSKLELRNVEIYWKNYKH